MNTIQLECFLAVAEHLNFARAAEEVHISQPAVTHQINSLETELGVKLFTRTTRSVKPTMEGINFIADAKSIVKSMHMARARLSSSRENAFSAFSIGCHNTVEFQFMPDIIAEFCRQFPRIHPLLNSTPFQALENLLDNGSIDLMFNFRQEKGIKKSWVYHEIIKTGIVCAMSPNHQLSSHTVITEKMLSREKLILLDPRRLPSEIFMAQAPLVSSHLPADLYFCESFESALTLTDAGLGLTLLPDIKPMESSKLLYLPYGNPVPLSYGIYYKEENRTPVLKNFLKIVDAFFDTYRQNG